MRTITYDKLETIYRKFNGYVSTKALLNEGLSNRQIAALAEEGYLDKVCHGYYWLAGKGVDKPLDYKCIEVCLSDPKAVVCMKSALYYQGMLEIEPEYLSVATERTDRSLLKMNFLTDRHYFSDRNFQIGITKKKTQFGCYNIYNIERSICDLFRLESEITVEIINYTRDNEQQYQRLLKYAELFALKKTVVKAIYGRKNDKK